MHRNLEGLDQSQRLVHAPPDWQVVDRHLAQDAGRRYDEEAPAQDEGMSGNRCSLSTVHKSAGMLQTALVHVGPEMRMQ